MSSLHYYRWYARDFRDSPRVAMLSFEERAAYREVLDLIFLGGGRYPDNSGVIARKLGISKSRWNQYRASLIAQDLLQNAGNFLENERMTIEHDDARRRHEKACNAADSRWTTDAASNAQGNASSNASAMPALALSLALSLERKEGVPDGTLSPARVVELWNEISNGTLPHVRMLTPGRRKHIALRLGADAERQKPEWWTSLFRRVVESAFCRGENNRKWRANLDFVVRSEDQIARILEGQYDGAGAVGGSVRAAPQRRPDGIREIR